MARLFLLPVLAVLAMVVFLGSVFAADVTPTTTSVNVGWFANFAAQYVMPALGAVVAIILGHLASMLKTKLGVDIDAGQRDALQTALTNAAGLLIHKGVTSLEGKSIDVGNPLIAAAVKYVQDSAPAALKHFDLGPDDIALRIASKLAQAPSAIVAPAK